LLHDNGSKKNDWWQNVISAAGYRLVLSCCGVQRLIALSLFFSDGTKLGYKTLHLHYVETTFPSGSGILNNYNKWTS
jgi:hypothetical protein